MANKKNKAVEPAVEKTVEGDSFEKRTGVKMVKQADIEPAIVEDPGNGKTFDERTSPTPPWQQAEK